MLQEGVSDHRHERMTVKALPRSALKMIKTEFFFHLLVSLLAYPSRLDGGRDACQSHAADDALQRCFHEVIERLVASLSGVIRSEVLFEKHDGQDDHTWDARKLSSCDRNRNSTNIGVPFADLGADTDTLPRHYAIGEIPMTTGTEEEAGRTSQEVSLLGQSRAVELEAEDPQIRLRLRPTEEGVGVLTLKAEDTAKLYREVEVIGSEGHSPSVLCTLRKCGTAS